MKYFSRFVSIVFLSFSVLLLFYVFYRAQIYHSGKQFDYYLKYYFIAFLFIILSFISFFIPKKLKANMAIASITILIFTYLFEGYLIIKFNLDKKQIRKKNAEIYKKYSDINYDVRSWVEVYQNLKKENPAWVISIKPSEFLFEKNLSYLPLSGLPNRKTLIPCNENGYYPSFLSDRHGFNNPDLVWDKNKIEFLLVGDSQLLGYCVNEPITMAGVLRRLNGRKNNIINLGYGGHEPLMQYAVLKEYFNFKKTKRVVWFLYDRDLEDLGRELENPILLNYLKDKNFIQSIFLKNKNKEELFQNKLKQSLSEKMKIFKFIKLDKVRFFFKIEGIDTYDYQKQVHEYNTIPFKEFQNIFKLVDELTKENKSKFYVVYLPDYLRYMDINYPEDFFHYEEAIKIIKNLNIPIINLKTDLFDKHANPKSLFPLGKLNRPHYTEEGFKLAAELVFKKIEELER